jgi:hypothetical protein
MAASAMTREGAYQELLGLARHSFGTYVVESSSPVAVDSADQKLMALFREVYEKERYYVERAYELLDKSGFRPLPPTYSLKASNYNFLRPVKLAEHWSEAVAEEIARLQSLKGRVDADDPCRREFERLLDDFLALRRESAKRVAAKLAEVTPKPPPPAPAFAAAPAAAAPKSPPAAAPAPPPPAKP